jgi:nicotinamide mononucleotide (NMN) deamidase PncC
MSFNNLRPTDILHKLTSESHHAGYLLLDKLVKIKNDRKITLTIGTAESLTAGLIFSTLVNIPLGGIHKYGAFSVYQTDAKRVFLGVTANDVYTLKCASEMAIGVLKNSNASVAIAVTGNAMPDQTKPDDMKQSGEVFIGIAIYIKDASGITHIKATSKVVNLCITGEFTSTCELYYNTVSSRNELNKLISKIEKEHPGIISEESKKIIKPLLTPFNNYETTSLMSNFIRNKTAEVAYLYCTEFINDNIQIITTPEFVNCDIKSVLDKLPKIPDHNYTNNKYLTDRDCDIEINDENMTEDRTVDTINKYEYIPSLTHKQKYLKYKKKYLQLKK